MTGSVEALPTSPPAPITAHSGLSGLGADDHLQYALLAGRALGQTLIGGTGAGELLGLQGSSNANRGRVEIRGGADIDWNFVSDAITSGGIRFANTIPASGGLISANIFLTNDIVVNNGLFIMSALDDATTLRWTVAPGFAVTTLFFARQTYRSTSAGIAPAQAFNYAAQCSFHITGAGNVTTTNYRALSFAPILRADNAGDQMHLTNIVGLFVGPLWNTRNATAVADFGTIRGVHMANPGQVLFGLSLGTETADNVIGLDMNSITIATTGVRAVVRSALVNSAINYFLLNTGGADSTFGAGDIHFNDNTYVKFGGAITDGDIWLGWQSAIGALNFSTFGGVGGNPLMLRPTAADEWYFQQNAANDIGLAFNMNAIVFGTTAPTPNSNNWFVQFAGPNLRQVQIGGEYSDVLWTASGSIDVDGNAVSNLQAFKINSVAVILNGGSIVDNSSLFLEGMSSFGATNVQALRVLGRFKHEGRFAQLSESPAQITADQDDYQLSPNNAQRGVVRLDSDDDWTITGIDSAFGRAQEGDVITLFNIGSFNLTLSNEDAASLAANRFQRANGLDLVLAPGDSIDIWKDDGGTDRWRFKEVISTGAGLLSSQWKFRTDTGAADPGPGRLRYDNATPASVTNIYIDQFNDIGGDVQNILSALANGDQLYIQAQGDASDFLVLDITSVTDNTGWFTIAVTVNASGTLPSNNAVLTVSARFA